jgi:hypothetical protein
MTRVNEVNKVNRVGEVNKVNRVNKVNKANRVSEVDRVNKVDKVGEVDKVSEVNKVNKVNSTFRDSTTKVSYKRVVRVINADLRCSINCKSLKGLPILISTAKVSLIRVFDVL